METENFGMEPVAIEIDLVEQQIRYCFFPERLLLLVCFEY
jgi:hypothetical protein